MIITSHMQNIIQIYPCLLKKVWRTDAAITISLTAIGGGGVKIGSWNVIVLENLELECHCLRKVGSWIVIVL
jgi:hypothetical protein